MDGAVGTMLAPVTRLRPDSPVELLSITEPEKVLSLHRSYIQAGAEWITTNSFSAHPITLQDAGLSEKAQEINRCAARLARRAVGQMDHPALVAGSVGLPPVQASHPSGNDVRVGFRIQIEALLEGGADLIFLETLHHTALAIEAFSAIQEIRSSGRPVEVAVSLAVNPAGSLSSGEDVKTLIHLAETISPLFLGVNCISILDDVKPVMDILARSTTLPLALRPSAGLPDSGGSYPADPDTFVRSMTLISREGLLNYAGGCCGTTPDHIRLLARSLQGIPCRRLSATATP